MNVSTLIVAAPDVVEPRRVPPVSPHRALLGHVLGNKLLWLGLLCLSVPTLVTVARESWSTEQGAHGPIVLATGLWLLFRQADAIRALARPGHWFPTTVLLGVSLVLYAASRITSLPEIEGYALYGALIGVMYANWGGAVLRLLWFPLLYMAFLFPPPETLVEMVTQPLKIGISEAAVELLGLFGYPIAGSGVSIFIGQYELLVAAACAGLNSLISLTAIGLFYIYIRHNANWRYAALLMLAVVPVAIIANFVRVIILVLTTYYAGEAVAQGFVHSFAGITLFLVAVLTIFLIDVIASPLRRMLETRFA